MYTESDYEDIVTAIYTKKYREMDRKLVAKGIPICALPSAIRVKIDGTDKYILWEFDALAGKYDDSASVVTDDDGDYNYHNMDVLSDIKASKYFPYFINAINSYFESLSPLPFLTIEHLNKLESIVKKSASDNILFYSGLIYDDNVSVKPLAMTDMSSMVATIKKINPFIVEYELLKSGLDKSPQDDDATDGTDVINKFFYDTRLVHKIHYEHKDDILLAINILKDIIKRRTKGQSIDDIFCTQSGSVKKSKGLQYSSYGGNSLLSADKDKVSRATMDSVICALPYLNFNKYIIGQSGQKNYYLVALTEKSNLTINSAKEHAINNIADDYKKLLTTLKSVGVYSKALEGDFSISAQSGDTFNVRWALKQLSQIAMASSKSKSPHIELKLYISGNNTKQAMSALYSDLPEKIKMITGDVNNINYGKLNNQESSASPIDIHVTYIDKMEFILNVNNKVFAEKLEKSIAEQIKAVSDDLSKNIAEKLTQNNVTIKKYNNTMKNIFDALKQHRSKNKDFSVSDFKIPINNNMWVMVSFPKYSPRPYIYAYDEKIAAHGYYMKKSINFKDIETDQKLRSIISQLSSQHLDNIEIEVMQKIQHITGEGNDLEVAFDILKDSFPEEVMEYCLDLSPGVN
jgi:hypothetical protein